MYYTVFDIETTGFSPAYCDIIQFAYVNLDENFKPLKAESLYFYKDDMHWSEEAEAVHHISKDFLKQFKDDFEVNVKKLYIILSRGNVVHFNGDGFDIPFCTSWLTREGMPRLTINRSYDVMKIYRPVLKKKPALSDMPMYIGLPLETIDLVSRKWFNYTGKSHDASFDVTETALAFTNAVRNKYVHDASKDVLSVDEQRARESKLWEKNYFALEDFSEIKCYVIKDDMQYVVNTCSNKANYAYFKIPETEWVDVMTDNLYRGMQLPVAFTNSMIQAVDSKAVFVKDTNGDYKFEIVNGMYACLEDTGSYCKYAIVTEKR